MISEWGPLFVVAAALIIPLARDVIALWRTRMRNASVERLIRNGATQIHVVDKDRDGSIMEVTVGDAPVTPRDALAGETES